MLAMHLQDCHGNYGLEESLSPELVLMSAPAPSAYDQLVLCSKSCSFFEHNQLPFVQDAYFLGNALEQSNGLKKLMANLEDKGHYSTKDHSFHFERDEHSLMME